MNKQNALNVLQNNWSSCRSCKLHEERNNIVFGYGNPNASILIVGEAPGSNEDRLGYPFVGASGELLDQYLGQVSVRPEIQNVLEEINKTKNRDAASILFAKLREYLLEDYYYTNVVMCRPPDNRDPTPKELEACKARLHEQIYIIDPALIICAGKISAQALIGKKLSITNVRGDIFDIDIQGKLGPVKYPVMAVLHPSFLMRSNDFNQKGGNGVKTYNDFVRAQEIIHKYKSAHYAIDIPTNRPEREE